jgi:hypothetical protein
MLPTVHKYISSLRRWKRSELSHAKLYLSFVVIFHKQHPIVYRQLDCNMLIWSRKFLWQKKNQQIEGGSFFLRCDCISQKDGTIMKDTTTLLSTCIISLSFSIESCIMFQIEVLINDTFLKKEYPQHLTS